MKVIKTISVDPVVWKKFEEYAKSQGRSISSLVEEFMRSKIKQG